MAATSKKCLHMVNDMNLKLSIGKKYHTNMNQAGMILLIQNGVEKKNVCLSRS